MTALQLLPSVMSRTAWTSAQALRARARMSLVWQRYLRECHGLWAVELSSESLSRENLRIPHVYRFSESFLAQASAWPIQPLSLDLVIWRVAANDIAELPAVLAQMGASLGPSARILIWIESPLLNSWCQIGMPLCLGHDWVLCQSTWGDARPVSLFPELVANKWSAAWQQWLPFGAEWSVQLWQRETICPNTPRLKRRAKKSASTTLGWQPQSTIDHSAK